MKRNKVQENGEFGIALLGSPGVLWEGGTISKNRYGVAGPDAHARYNIVGYDDFPFSEDPVSNIEVPSQQFETLSDAIGFAIVYGFCEVHVVAPLKHMDCIIMRELRPPHEGGHRGLPAGRRVSHVINFSDDGAGVSIPCTGIYATGPPNTQAKFTNSLRIHVKGVGDYPLEVHLQEIELGGLAKLTMSNLDIVWHGHESAARVFESASLEMEHCNILMWYSHKVETNTAEHQDVNLHDGSPSISGTSENPLFGVLGNMLDAMIEAECDAEREAKIEEMEDLAGDALEDTHQERNPEAQAAFLAFLALTSSWSTRRQRTWRDQCLDLYRGLWLDMDRSYPEVFPYFLKLVVAQDPAIVKRSMQESIKQYYYNKHQRLMRETQSLEEEIDDLTRLQTLKLLNRMLDAEKEELLHKKELLHDSLLLHKSLLYESERGLSQLREERSQLWEERSQFRAQAPVMPFKKKLILSALIVCILYAAYIICKLYLVNVRLYFLNVREKELERELLNTCQLANLNHVYLPACRTPLVESVGCLGVGTHDWVCFCLLCKLRFF
eukprot:gnl/MRDRNA2_/MRDRNA2_74364_c0_seq1.p1 gnl/MRDRNA2_/MRDRNA2_74364_c0~~gnl/MRDRNA2_/MRDRNA2_74364_c0_seq1.p1  ORF type:complete len:589 (-),score=68.28 gnl/MRDRNA2_/MRDRNA2_74364_c0_seq1:9-1667(-)